MKKFFIMVALVLGTMTAVANDSTKVVIREGNNFTMSPSKKETTKVTIEETDYTWEIKGIKYPIYITSNGRCLIYRTSAKTGNVYKSYLPKEVCLQICQELGVEYKEL